MIFADDIGYSEVKDCQYRIFRSAMTTEDSAMSRGTKVEIDGKVRFVGVGPGNMDVEKFDSELSKVLLLTNLYFAGGTDYQLVTGLPISQYPTQKGAYKDSILKYQHSRVNGRMINIQDVTICPQAVGALYFSGINRDCVVVDVGGRTVDLGLFEHVGGKFYICESNTLYAGMEPLYSEVVKAVNARYGLSLNGWQGESILRNGLTLDGIKQDTDFLQPLIAAHFEEVCNELEFKYSVRTTETLLCGGGAETISKLIKKFAPAARIMDNPQFANALGFQIMGRSIYGKQA